MSSGQSAKRHPYDHSDRCQARDPVCGMAVDRTSTPYRIERDGIPTTNDRWRMKQGRSHWRTAVATWRAILVAYVPFAAGGASRALET